MNENRDTPTQEQADRGETTGEGDAVSEALARGETVRAEVVEHATIESELVDSEVIGREIVGSELLTEDIVGVALVEEVDVDSDALDREAFEADDRFYLAADDYGDTTVEEAVIAVEVDETRSEIEEVYEQKTIETRVVDQDEELEMEIEGVHQHLLDSDLIQVEDDEVVLDDLVIEGEFVEDDAVRSHLTERQTVEREVAERKTLTAAVTDVDTDGGTVTTEQIVERDLVDVDELPELETQLDLEVEEDVGAAEADVAETGAAAEFTEGDIGKDAVLPSGEQIGLVSDVEPDANTVYVEPDPGLTDKIKASLQWGDEKDSYPLDGSQIQRITEDAVVVESEI